MKITKTGADAFFQREKMRIANLGCNTCPCCHENMSFGEAIKKGYGLSRGISSIVLTRPIKSGLFSWQDKSVTKYSCNRCGAEWESELY